MSDYRLPYGKTYLTARVPDDRPVEWIAPRDVPAAPDPVRLVKRALEKTVGDVRLRGFAGVDTVAIAIADKTRPLPRPAIYPLLDHLAAVGIVPDAITLLIAAGTHAPMTPDEFSDILPADLLARYRVLSHDCDAGDLVTCGTTSRGTPAAVNREWFRAGLRIVMGNIEPHQFMGFSGGVKSAAIGLMGRATINANHALMNDPCSDLGRYEDNPARQDVEEIGRLIDVHFALNTVLNRDKQIVHVLAGEPVAVMQAGIPLVRALYEIPVSAPCHLVITSPGGHPKDINLYQAQKAVAHAARITRPGGTVILVAACPEGSGSRAYEQWIAGMVSHEAVLERFAREEFCLGPHKAFQIARDAVRVRVLIVSDMPAALVRRLLLTPAGSLDEALSETLAGLPPDARIGIMPSANATVPVTG